MNKKELIGKVSDTLAAAGIRKPIHIKSEKLTVSRGDEKAVFTIEGRDRLLRYNNTDVCNILDAVIAVIEDSIHRGEPVGIRGFGVWELRKTKARTVREPDAEIWHDIPEMYKAKFTAGCNLAAAAQAHKLMEDELGPEAYLPKPDGAWCGDYDDDEDGDGACGYDDEDEDEEGEDAAYAGGSAADGVKDGD